MLNLLPFLYCTQFSFAAPLEEDGSSLVQKESHKLSVDEAEILRLREQMNRYQESGALEYSEKIYQQMLEIDTRQRWMSDGDHLAGAMAANSRGDLAETLERLERCLSSERAVQWRSFMWAETGAVRIERIEGAQLSIMMGLMSPDQIAAIDFANQGLSTQKYFEGRLPNGAYQYGEKQFLVSATGLTMASDATKEQAVSNPPKSMKAKTGVRSEGVLSGGVSALSSLLILGEGLILENNAVLDAQTMPAVSLTPYIGYTWSDWTLYGDMGLRGARNSIRQAYIIRPGVHLGRGFNRRSEIRVGSSIDVARLYFDDAAYIKRSVGYSVSGTGIFCLTEHLCVQGTIDGGLLGSHNTFSSGIGLQYTL